MNLHMPWIWLDNSTAIRYLGIMKQNISNSLKTSQEKVFFFLSLLVVVLVA